MTLREIAIHTRGFMWRQELEDWRYARIVAAVYDVNRNPKKRKKPFTAQDFMPKQKASGAKTPEAQKAILDALVHRTRDMPASPRQSTRHRAPVRQSR